MYSDIEILSKIFSKNQSIFDQYLKEQEHGERIIWIALVENMAVGYITLVIESDYERFREAKIPEIKDFNVLAKYRNQSIGSALIQKAEDYAATISNIVGLGVGLYGGEDGGYGPAQIMYIKRGYIPDGKCITYKSKSIEYGKQVTLDDDLCLFLLKKLK